MAAYQQINTYLNNHYDGMDPEQLILMLYKGALSRMCLTREGIKEKNAKKKGENLSKAIAIISELNASIDTNKGDESTLFLRGLYVAILAELPKVNLNNDLKTLDRAEKYISRLKEIWETDVMAKKKKPVTKGIKPSIPLIPQATFDGTPSKSSFHAISV